MFPSRRSAAARAPAAAADGLNDVLRQVRRIDLRTRRLVAALASGGYRSAFRGTGLEFEEVREYAAGDDVRSIDWNVTARAGRPYVKVFREERELGIVLLVDVSGSMRFGAIPGLSPRAKLASAAEATATLAVSALRNRDRIGLVAFAERTLLHLPARRGRPHALRLVREVLAAGGAGAGRADLAHALDEVRRVARRRSVVVLISDFIDAGAGLDAALARAARKHDVIGLRIADPGEDRLPPGGAPLVIADPEGDGELVLANGAKARAAYAAARAGERARVARAFAASGCDLVDLRTDAPAATALARFFARRGGRRG
jgi:uncharacterized protein (DUF58 family)